MTMKPRKLDVYDRIKRAWERKTGMYLSGEDVDILMDDTAIKDAVLETYAEDKE